jgi:signal transduction histidine kinase
MSLPRPRSMAGQLVAVVLLAVVLAQGASFLIFADERQLALESQRREQVAGRLVSTVELLAALPLEEHARLLRHTGTPQLRLWLADTSAVEAAEAGMPGRGRLERLLANRLGPLAREVRVEWRGATMALWRPWRHHEDERRPVHAAGFERRGEDDDERGGPRAPPPEGLVIAIRLADGRWLNAATVLPIAPPGPAWPALASMLVLAGAVVLGVALVVRRITSPLRELAQGAERLGRGETVPPLAEAGPEEVRRTTRAFNRMQARLRRFVDDRTRMLAAISHDLRTPITTLRLRAELLDDEEQRLKILATLDEMQRMAEATLAFAREEASSEETRVVDLAALIESLAEDLVDLGRDVTVAVPGRTPYPCRPHALKRAIRNLVENACVYGARARVALTASGSDLAVTVDDDGPGIPEADMERVFAPFVRLEPSRNPETGGIGLGLAIARTIARAHGGDVELLNRPEGGLRATLRLPGQERV